MATPIVITSVTIAAGTSLSPAVNLASARLLRIYTPTGWLSAPLTFQLSPDGVLPFRDVYQFDGRELTMTTVANSVFLLGVGNMAIGISFVKLRSGLSALPVIQPVDRTFQLISQP